MVITDHNTIAGAVAAQKLDPERVIIGEEILTQRGELLAAFVSETIPAGLPPREAITRLREQGAFISVSHPFDQLRIGHWALPDLLEILPLVDAIETLNARCLLRSANREATAFASEHGLTVTVGSDAHTAMELGNAKMILPDLHDAESLKTALREARHSLTVAPFWVYFATRYAVLKKKGSKS